MGKDSGRLLVAAMRDLDELHALQYSVELVSEGASSHTILEKLLEGLREVGARYDAGAYFIADLMMAGHILKSVMSKVLVSGGLGAFRSFGKVVIAAVSGNTRDLGENVLADVMRHNGFEVTDLGAGVPEALIVEAVRVNAPDILVLIGPMPGAPGRMAGIIAALTEASLRSGVRVIAGGASVTPEKAAALGADAFFGGIMDCLWVCHEFMARAAGEM